MNSQKIKKYMNFVELIINKLEPVPDKYVLYGKRTMKLIKLLVLDKNSSNHNIYKLPR
jgi:hypothetical protein